MRLNWFAPLPPAPVAAADLTRRLLPLLRERADLTLWTDQPAWDVGLEELAPVRRFDPARVPWPDVNRADVTVYHLGGTCDGGVREVLRGHPGVVVLHEPTGDPGTALGVVVSNPEAFEVLKGLARWPVALLTPPADSARDYAEALLHFAAACAGRPVTTAYDLTSRVAGEWKRWAGEGTPAGLAPVAQGICELFR